MSTTGEKTRGKLTDEIERMIWDLLDQQIDDHDTRRLEHLLSESEQVRLRYQACAQIHADLYSYYGAKSQQAMQSPVLGSLGGLSPGMISNPALMD